MVSIDCFYGYALKHFILSGACPALKRGKRHNAVQNALTFPWYGH